jgi:hypothetical protein
MHRDPASVEQHHRFGEAELDGRFAVFTIYDPYGLAEVRPL